MTEQPPSAASLWTELVEKDDRTSPEEYPDMALITFGELEYFLNHYAAQRVSAERGRLWRWAQDHYWDSLEADKTTVLTHFRDGLMCARAERPAPEGPQLGVWTEEGIRAADAKAEELHRYFHPEEYAAPPAAVVDYTERAREILTGFDGQNLDASDISQDSAWNVLFEEIAAALFAVASERDAAAIRAFGKRVWSDTEEVAYQAGVNDTRARLQEPDVQEAVEDELDAHMHGSITKQARAAIARIEKMLK